MGHGNKNIPRTSIQWYRIKICMAGNYLGALDTPLGVKIATHSELTEALDPPLKCHRFPSIRMLIRFSSTVKHL